MRKKYCYDFCHSVLPMFSSRNFMIYSLTFRSLIHFNSTFVCGILIELFHMYLSRFPSATY